MITQEQIKDLQGRLSTLRECLGIESKRKELSDKQALSQDAALWNDPKAAETLLKQIGSLKASILSFDSAATSVEDLEVLAELGAEGQELDQSYAQAVKMLEDLELRSMLG